MKFGMVNKLITVNIIVLDASHPNIQHIAVTTRKTNKKINFSKGVGGKAKILTELMDSKRSITIVLI